MGNNRCRYHWSIVFCCGFTTIWIPSIIEVAAELAPSHSGHFASLCSLVLTDVYVDAVYIGAVYIGAVYIGAVYIDAVYIGAVYSRSVYSRAV